MTSTTRPAPDNAPAVVTVDVAPATRVLVAGDLHLARRPTACSLAVAAELAAALDAWVGQGLLVLNGDVFDFADDAPQDPGRILDAHPRLAAALVQFASGEGRRVVFIVGTSDCTLVETGSRGAAVLRTRYDADVALAVRLRITTGAGQRLVRVEHGSRLGDDNDQPRSEAERLIGGGFAGLVTGHTHDPELTSLGSGFYANTGSCGTVVRPRQRRWGLSSVPVVERQLAWVELEAGADLHARLLYSRIDLSATFTGRSDHHTTGPGSRPEAGSRLGLPGRQRLAGTDLRRARTPPYPPAGRRRPRHRRGPEPPLRHHPAVERPPRHPPRPRADRACPRPPRRSLPPPASRCSC